VTATPLRIANPRGGRLGAVLDLAIWLAVVLLGAAAVYWLGRSGMASGLTIRIASPLQMLVLFGAATALLWRRGDRWRSIGLTRPKSLRRVAILVVGGYFGLIGINALLVLAVFPALHLAMPNFTAIGVLKGHPWAYAYMLMMAWASAGLGEELQFRGFLWSRLERLFGAGPATAGLALVVQAGLFGLGHVYQGAAGVIVTTAAGLVLGGVYLAGRRNLLACIVLHGLIDTVSLTVLFLGLADKAMTP
jgi:membrane protease YdiL (CAAX protease family)